MNVNGINIQGKSVSGYSTAIAIPEYNLVFDCGHATTAANGCEWVAITHGHLDHFGGVVRHAYIRGMTGANPSQFVVPTWLSKPLEAQMNFWADVQQARRAPFGNHALETGGSMDLPANRVLRSFKTDHRVPSQGYILSEVRKRLKAEYLGLEGRELGRLRREGVQIEDQVEIPIIGFTGDTRARLFDTFKPVAKVFMVECTFLNGDVSEDEAVKKGHVHINQLASREEAFAGVETLMLCHFSKRHTNREIESAINQLPKGLREKTTFLPL